MDAFDQRGITAAFTDAVLGGISGADATFDTTTTLLFAIKGLLYSKTAVTNGSAPTTDAFTAAAFKALATGKTCVFVWGYNAAGTVQVAQGPIVATADVTNGKAALEFPSIPDTMCPFAYHSVSHANATAWTFGTSNWNATGVTIDTVIPVSQLPAQPLTADTTA